MGSQRLVELGRLMSDATRVELLTVLCDGRRHTAGELSSYVGVAASTTSGHLSRLLDAGLVTTTAVGRHRYYALRGPETAEMIESLFVLGWQVSSLTTEPAPADLAYARVCFNHLAGTTGVGLTNRLVEIGAVAFEDQAPDLTPEGERLFAGLGVDVSQTDPTRHRVTRCLDWTEGGCHLAGSFSARLLDHFIDEGWFTRRPTGRALWITDRGRDGLASAFSYVAP